MSKKAALADHRRRLDEDEAEVRRILSETVRSGNSEQSRSIAAKMGISIHMLNAFTSNAVDNGTRKKKARLPAYLVKWLFEITGDERLLRFLMTPCLYRLVELGRLSENLVLAAASRKRKRE